MDQTEEALGNLDWNTLPIGANPKIDRRMPDDELGRARFQTSGGRVYSVSMAPAQENRGFESEPGTFDRVKDVAKKYATDLLEEAKSGVTAPARAARGEDVQVGEAMATAGMTALGGAAMPRPEGSLGVFGGRKAVDFAKDETGANLKTFYGVDGLERFEIDDFNSRVDPQNIPTTNPNSLSFNPDYDATTLGQAFDHPELYRQYPKLKDQKIIFDSSLRGTSTYGYFSGDGSLIALNPNLTPEQMRFTLLHEIQHAVQSIEGFDRGTNSLALYNSEPAKALARAKAGTVKADIPKVRAWVEDKKKEWEDFSPGLDFRVKSSIFDEVGEILGGDYRYYQGDSIKLAAGPLWSFHYKYNKLKEAANNASLVSTDESKSAYTSRMSVFYEDLADVINPNGRFSSKITDDQRLKLREIWDREVGNKISPEEFNSLGMFEKEEALAILGKIPIKPVAAWGRVLEDNYAPKVTDSETFEAYERKAGEAEARLTALRADMDRAQRDSKDPLTQLHEEDRALSKLWLSHDERDASYSLPINDDYASRSMLPNQPRAKDIEAFLYEYGKHQ